MPAKSSSVCTAFCVSHFADVPANGARAVHPWYLGAHSRFQTDKVWQRCGNASHRTIEPRKAGGGARGEDARGRRLGPVALPPGPKGIGRRLPMPHLNRSPPTRAGEIRPRGFPLQLGAAHIVARPRSESPAPEKAILGTEFDENRCDLHGVMRRAESAGPQAPGPLRRVRSTDKAPKGEGGGRQEGASRSQVVF